MSLVIERNINAPTDRVWAVLTDPAVLSSGGFGLAAVEGDFRPGSRVRIAVDEAPDKLMPFKVARNDPPRELSLAFSIFFGIIKMQMTVYLQGTSDGTIAELGFGTSGFLGKSVNRQVDQLKPRAEKFLNALARAAEAA